MSINRKRVGEVWLAHEGTKERPVLVLSGGIVKFEIDVIVARVTGQTSRNKFDIPLTYWKEAGLKKPSVVRCSKINTIQHDELFLKLGELHPDDLKKVEDTVRSLLFKDFSSEI